jgi:hypothetical protein
MRFNKVKKICNEFGLPYMKFKTDWAEYTLNKDEREEQNKELLK